METEPSRAPDENNGCNPGPISEARIATDDADQTVFTAIFDRRVTGSISLTKGHEHDQKRAKLFAERTARYRNAIKTKPELGARINAQRLRDGEPGTTVDEQTRTELNDVLRTI